MKTIKLSLMILMAGLLLVNNPVYSQNKYEVAFGVGVPELLSARIKYGRNLQVGVCAGFYTFAWYGSTVLDWSVAAEVTYHFLGKSKFVEVSPWYVLGGLGYFHLPVYNIYEDYDVACYPRIGRTFNFSKRVGINMDIGAFLPLSAATDIYPYSYSFQALWCGNVNFFVRF